MRIYHIWEYAGGLVARALTVTEAPAVSTCAHQSRAHFPPVPTDAACAHSRKLSVAHDRVEAPPSGRSTASNGARLLVARTRHDGGARSLDERTSRGGHKRGNCCRMQQTLPYRTVDGIRGVQVTSIVYAGALGPGSGTRGKTR